MLLVFWYQNIVLIQIWLVAKFFTYYRIFGIHNSHWKGHREKTLLLQGIIGILDLLEFEGQHLLPVFAL